MLSQDADCFMFKAPKLIKNLTLSGKRKKPGAYAYEEVLPEVITHQELLDKLEITNDQLIVLGILVGTDYNIGGIKGIGPKKALTLVKKYGEEFEELFKEGVISDHIWKSMSEPLRQHAQALADAVSESLNADPSVEEEVFESAIREMLISQRSAVNKMLRDGTITEETYSQLTAEVDTALNENHTNQSKIILSRARKPIENLMAIIIQDFDVENVIAVLNRLGTPVTRLTSSGGFLGKKNNTLLVGVSNQEYDVVIDVIKKTSKSRTEVIPGFHDSSENDRSVTIVGANIFQFEVEHYEEF